MMNRHVGNNYAVPFPTTLSKASCKFVATSLGVESESIICDWRRSFDLHARCLCELPTVIINQYIYIYL